MGGGIQFIMKRTDIHVVIISMVIATIVSSIFWFCVLYKINTMWYETINELSKVQQKAEILATMATCQEWYIADEKRKNAAYRERLLEKQQKKRKEKKP